MRKLMVYLAFAACIMIAPIAAQAYTIDDPVPDAIGIEFESYGINITGYTPPVYSGGIAFDVFTDYPVLTGVTVGAWATQAADIFINETYYGNSYEWAIPLINHGSFVAGNMYAVGSYRISDSFDPSPGSFLYNHNIPVWIDTLGTNYNGFQVFSGGAVTSNPLGGNPAYRVNIPFPTLYQDDPNGVWNITWGTATCANDVVSGRIPAVPEPATMLLLGLGLVGVAGIRRIF